MQYKRIVFTKANTAELLLEDLPDPAEDEVQVRLMVSTISSGTERANLTGSRSVAWNRPEAESAVFPRKLGYSSSGIITKTGSKVNDFLIGDRVALSWSTHSEYVNLKEQNVHHLPDGISFENGALFHIATFPLAAIRKCRLEIGESAVVMGMGILGLAAVQLLKIAGAVPIIAVDPNPAKRKKAVSIGADYAFDPFDPAFSDQVRSVTGGGAHVAIEVTGNGSALDQVLDCMARLGRVALLGCTRSSDFSLDYYRKVHGPGISLIGAHTNARPAHDSSTGWWTEYDDFEALIRLTALDRLHLDRLVEEVHPPADAPAVYTRLSIDRSFPVVQFDWSRDI